MHTNGDAIRYFVDRMIRSAIMWLMNRMTRYDADALDGLERAGITRILLVRGLFRLGDAILATPAILLVRQNFPQARIDFVGPSISKGLFRTLPIDNYFEIQRRLPTVVWSYLLLIKQLRRNHYDLAIDVSGSSAAMGSFLVGFSRARWRVGLRGRWDRWFNIRLARSPEKNKYAIWQPLVESMGLSSALVYPTIGVSAPEVAAAKQQMEAKLIARQGPIVGIFIGGRQAKGKRWDKINFCQLAQMLLAETLRPIIFVGPEERELRSYFEQRLGDQVPVLFEPSIRGFAALVANCDLFIACDSGPVHLACALRIPTIAIFLKNNFDRWGPPIELARTIYNNHGTVTVAAVAAAARDAINDVQAAQRNCA